MPGRRMAGTPLEIHSEVGGNADRMGRDSSICHRLLPINAQITRLTVLYHGLKTWPEPEGMDHMKTWKSVAAAAAALVLTSACITKENTNTVTAPAGLVFDKTYTLQGIVADAVTGARVGGNDLKLYLVQGPDIRTPTRITRDAADPLFGEFAFSGIPADFNPTNKTYKVVAVQPGYQRFEADITFQASSGSQLDTIYNRIGNIYLFPVGVTAPSYTFAITYNGKPVPSATVQLDPMIASNSMTFNPADALPATTGLLASLSGTTDATGKVTFAGANLALGGAYQVSVLPAQFVETAGNTVPLARFTSVTNLLVGISNVLQQVALADLVPNAGPVYLTGASNQAVGQVVQSGQLVLTFSAPVTLVNPTATSFSAVLANAVTATLGTPQAAASLSTDGLTLTLTPNFTVVPGATDRGLQVIYGDGTALVSPRSYPAATLRVFGDLRFANGGAPSGVVAVQAP
jgi:hypothetical protein